MLYSYIISNDSIKDYFPETSDANLEEYEEGGDATIVATNLICVKSNKWIDILEKDRYIPFSFTSECTIDPKRSELMIRYIEKITDTKGIYLSEVKRLGENGCEYFCYIGDDSLYVTEHDSYNMKEDLSIFEKGDIFLTDKEHEGKCYDISHIEPGIWYSSEDVIENSRKTYFDKSQLGCDILALHDNYDGKYFNNLNPIHIEHLLQIEGGMLPSAIIEKKKWPGMIDIMIRKEDPIHSPIKILKNLQKGRFHFGNFTTFEEDLKNVKDYKVHVIVTDKPLELIYTLKMNDIDYLLIENDGIYEIIAQCDTFPECSSSFPSYEDYIKDSCKNSKEILKLPPIDQMNFFIDDGYGIKLERENMIYVNPHTKTLLPQNIIHSVGTLCSGIGIPIQDYDPHREVHIDVPVKVEIERINKEHVSIYVKTHQERYCLEENFPYHGEEDELEMLIRKLWVKGYLLDDLGLVSILYYNRMHKGSIIKPWWFQHRDHHHANSLLEFISSL